MTGKRAFAIGGGVGIALVLALWIAVSPYITLRAMQSAVQRQDVETLSGYIDYGSLRASIKRQTTAALAAKVSQRGGSPAQAAIATVAVDRMVDAFVQPAMIAMMLADTTSDKNPVGGRIVGDGVRLHRTGLGTFEVTGTRPGSVVFEMRGLRWKLVGVDAHGAI
jgi:hypothetical protein